MIKVVDTEQEILELEQLRLKCTRSYSVLEAPKRTFFGEKLLNRDFIGLSIVENEEMIAGCIISDHLNNLYIEWIFTHPDYRKKGYASKLLKYIEHNIDTFSEYYSEDFHNIQLEPYAGAEGFYLNNGYHTSKNDHMVKPILH